MPGYLEGLRPPQPSEPELLDAYRILERAEDACEAFFRTFDNIRIDRGALGTSTDNEQDLLRAALGFASAGLDAVAKQLIRDALIEVLRRDHGAQQQFASFVETRLRKASATNDSQFDAKLMASLLICDSPRQALEKDLIYSLTSGSLQSKDELFRVASFFAISANGITKNIKLLKDIFDARNQIAHEMDIDFSKNNRSRRQRARETMVEFVREIFRVTIAFVNEVQKKLQQPVL